MRIIFKKKVTKDFEIQLEGDIDEFMQHDTIKQIEEVLKKIEIFFSVEIGEKSSDVTKIKGKINHEFDDRYLVLGKFLNINFEALLNFFTFDEDGTITVNYLDISKRDIFRITALIYTVCLRQANLNYELMKNSYLKAGNDEIAFSKDLNALKSKTKEVIVLSKELKSNFRLSGKGKEKAKEVLLNELKKLNLIE